MEALSSFGLAKRETEDLREFLREYVTSFEELEILLFFLRAPRRGWTLLELAAALNLSEELVEAALGGLSEKFVAREAVASSTPTYRYAPDPGLEPLVELLQRTYDEQRPAIVQIMSSNAMQRVRSSAARQLAEAFRLERSRK